ncbi:MAG: nucleotide exchange factor GrpE [Pseudolabrys sp.]|jgi:molecular chaperone GrpE
MADQSAADDMPAPAAGEAAAASPEMVPAAQVTAALEAAAEFKDKHLRTLAEMENLRRRTEREVADARVYGVTGFARDVLAVADNMHRALEALGPELHDQVEPKIKSLIEGVELTERELMKTLEKNGVRKFTPEGEKFDPNVHQAMYEVKDSDLPPGHVAQVIQAGYMLGDRVLRPALVGITKSAPRAARPSANDNPQADDAAE